MERKENCLHKNSYSCPEREVDGGTVYPAFLDGPGEVKWSLCLICPKISGGEEKRGRGYNFFHPATAEAVLSVTVDRGEADISTQRNKNKGSPFFCRSHLRITVSAGLEGQLHYSVHVTQLF